MSLASKKVPAAIVSGVICLCLGVAAGVGVMAALGRTDPQVAANPTDGDNTGKEGAGSKAGMPGMKGGKGGGGGGKAGPSPKAQLTQLVNKLDDLTAKPLTVQLTTEQKQQAKDLLAGLDAKDELADAEAKEKLDALLKLVESQKEVLEKAGYRWPGQGGGGGGGPAPPPPNPFKTDANAAHLKSLQTTLGK